MKSQVTCDFSKSPPAKIIHHNKEQTMNVHGYETPSSYVINVHYNIPLSSLTSFIDMADACSQHLKTYRYPLMCYILFISSQVECDFSTSPPANIINHNKLATMHVKGKEPIRSYVIDITYNADATAINTLIDSADSCSQYLKTKCHHTGQQYWGWKGRSGQLVTKFFPGGDPTIGGCACKKTNSCANSSELFFKKKKRLQSYTYQLIL